MKTTKDLLRKVFRQKRNSFVKQNQQTLTDSFYVKYSRQIADLVHNHDIAPEEGSSQRPLMIGAFYPVNNEINCLSIINNLKAMSSNCAFSLPIVASDGGKVLTFREYTDESCLVPGAFKVPIPNDKSPIVYPDALLVPLLSFNQDKYRLGYGGGYYDSTINALRKQKKDLLTIGIAFDIQESEELPLEDHDMQLDYILTQNRLLH